METGSVLLHALVGMCVFVHVSDVVGANRTHLVDPNGVEFKTTPNAVPIWHCDELTSDLVLQ